MCFVHGVDNVGRPGNGHGWAANDPCQRRSSNPELVVKMATVAPMIVSAMVNDGKWPTATATAMTRVIVMAMAYGECNDSGGGGNLWHW